MATSTLSWIFLFFAGLLEVAWTLGMKYSEGFSKVLPTIFTAVSLFLSMYFLSRSLLHIPLGTAYAIWVGIGALGAAIAGIVLFKEPASVARLIFLFLLLISIVGLKVTAP